MENRVLVIAHFLVLLFSPLLYAEGCIKGQFKFEVLKDGAHYYVAELEPKWREAPVVLGKHLREMHKKVESRGSTDPIQLFRRQMKHFEPQSAAVSAIESFIKGDFGRIRGIGCLEAALLENHMSNYPDPSEFAAILMAKDGEFKIHVYTFRETWAVSHSAVFENAIEELILQGWQPLTHIHNHPFYEGEILNGLVMASHSDAGVYKDYAMRWGIKSAWITNGISTAKFRQEEFARLNREWEISTAHNPRFWR